MSGFLANFFSRRAGQQQGSTAAADPAGQFDLLLSQYHSSVKGLGARTKMQLYILFISGQNARSLFLCIFFSSPFSAEAEHVKLNEAISEAKEVGFYLCASCILHRNQLIFSLFSSSRPFAGASQNAPSLPFCQRKAGDLSKEASRCWCRK